MEENEGAASTRKEIATGFVWTFGERLATQVVSFGVSIALARVLSPSDYGIIAMVLVFISLADVFVTSGFSSALIQKNDADETDFSTLFYCSLASGLAIYVILFLCAPAIAAFYNQPLLTAVLRVFAIRIPISSLSAIQHAYVSRNLLFRRLFWSSLIGTIASGIVGVAMAYAGFGVWALVAQYFTDTIIDAVVLLFTIRWRPHLLFSWDAAKALMGFGWKVLAADLSGTLFGQIRSLVIGRVYTSADLAFYNKGDQLPRLAFANLSTAIMNVLFPVMSNSSDDVPAVRHLCRRFNQTMSFLAAPVLFGIAATAHEIILILFTEKWLASVPYMQVLSLGFTIALLGVAPIQSLKAIGRSDVVLKLEFIKKPVYVLLLLVGVRYGTLAIAYTMALYELYGTLVNAYQMKRYLGYGALDQAADVLPAFLMSTAMAALVYFMPVTFESPIVQLLVKTGVGIVAYLLLSACLRPPAFRYVLRHVRMRLDPRRQTIG